MLSSQDHSMFSYDPSPAGMVCRQWKPSVERAPNCPRCDSSNTKFCYYNNYSLSQPRYFCKGCRRYWTKGGSLRNVPVGGGCRKTRRGRSSARNPADGAAEVDRQRLPATSAVRPDLALDGAVRTMDSKEAEKGGGPAIDLAVLYAKYLNQCPEQSEPPIVVPDFAGVVLDQPEPVTSVASSSNDPNLECRRQDQILGVELLMSSHADDYHQLNFEDHLDPFSDPSKNLDSFQLHQIDQNSFFPSDTCDLDVPQSVSEEIRYQLDFETLIPPFSSSIHQCFSSNDDHWSSTTQLDYPSLETFYRP